MKRVTAKRFRNGAILLILLSLIVGVIPLRSSAAELAGHANCEIVRIKNVASGKYLNVGLGVDADGTNVYQYTADGSIEQKFKLKYNQYADVYYIGAMCSSNGNNRVVSIDRGSSSLSAGMNVQIYTAADTTAQQWKFTHYGQGKYAISPKANSALFLTAYGTSNGSSSGRSSTSAGNVYIAGMLGEEDGLPVVGDNQLWTIQTVQNEMSIASGCYRIKNKNSGKYMTATADNTVDQREKEYATIWEVVYCDLGTTGYYLIYIAGEEMTDGIVSNISYSNAMIYPSIANISYMTGTEYMMFIIKNQDDTDSYRIASRDSYNAFTMTVFTGSTAENAQVCETGYTGANSQRWVFESVYDDGQKHILMNCGALNKCAGLFSDDNLTDFNNTFVELTSVTYAKNNQRWRFVNVANGYHTIVNDATGLCLTVEDSVAAEGAAVKLDYYDGLDGQLWRIIGLPGDARIVSKLGDNLNYYNNNNYILSNKHSMTVDDYTFNNYILCLTKTRNNESLWNISYTNSFWFNSRFFHEDYWRDLEKEREDDPEPTYEEELEATNNCKNSAAHIKGLTDDIINKYLLSENVTDEIVNYTLFFREIVKHDFVLILNHGNVDRDTKVLTGLDISNGNDITLSMYDENLTDDESLLGTDLMIWLTCKAGYGGVTGSNFAKLSYEKGAETVLTWIHSLYISDANEWMEYFYAYATDPEYTLQKMIDTHALRAQGESMKSDFLVSFGNLDRTLEEVLQ